MYYIQNENKTYETYWENGKELKDKRKFYKHGEAADEPIPQHQSPPGNNGGGIKTDEKLPANKNEKNNSSKAWELSENAKEFLIFIIALIICSSGAGLYMYIKQRKQTQT